MLAGVGIEENAGRVGVVEQILLHNCQPLLVVSGRSTGQVPRRLAAEQLQHTLIQLNLIASIPP